MKKLLAVLTISLITLGAFAQGRLLFGNDSLHLVYYDPNVFGPPLGGTAVSTGNMPPGINLVVDLYLGTTSGLLSLTTTTTFSSTGGKWNTVNVMAPGIPGGSTVFVKIQVRNGAYAPEASWRPNFVPPDIYWGFSVEFPFTLGSTLTYPPIWDPPDGPWPPGDFPLPGGGLGAIPVGYIPEPSAITLAGLGALAMFVFRKPLISKHFKAFQK
jgi:hypothetical protein